MVCELDTRNFSYSRADQARTSELREAASSVSNQLPGEHTVSVFGLNSLTGTPNLLRSSNAHSTNEPLIEAALKHVQKTSLALGFGSSEPAEFIPDPTVEQTSAGSYAVHLQQDYRGIPVFQMARTVRFSPNREITEVAGNNAELPAGINIAPQIDVVQAVRAAAQYVATSDDSDQQRTDGWGQQLPAVNIDVSSYEPRVLVSFPMTSRPTVLDKGPFEDLIPAHLVIFYQNPDARLGWHMVIAMPEYQAQYEVIVSADRQQPEILYCQNTVHTSLGKGNVYVENPQQTPKHEISFPRDLVDYPLPRPDRLPEGFPGEWCTDDSCIGNNTIATLGNSLTTFRGRRQENTVVFEPGTEDEQKILNIFYFCNYMHDFFYMLGFNEAAGNFQKNNSSSDGLPGDPVLARAHSGTVNGTANMLTPVDGQSPIMNMGLVASTRRHTAFDADVVFHEFVHGVSNRLVGGRINNSALMQPQSRGMGEGWSDYFALTIQSYGKPNEKIVTGDWVVNNPQGIRGYPYDSNFPDGFDKLGTGRYREEHNIGEIWCATLMQMNRNIGEALGDRKRGHQIGWQIVVDGLKLTPTNPSFLDARDAILRALDHLLVAGKLSQLDYANVRRAAWQAFSKFGMGPNADCRGASLEGIVADIELPNDL